MIDFDQTELKWNNSAKLKLFDSLIFVKNGELILDGRLNIEIVDYKNLYNLIGKKFLNKKTFPYGKKINFNSIRKGEIIGEHEVKFSSGKEIITLNHEAFDRALYSDGALTASKWLMKKKPGLYSMRDLLNFS